MTAVVLVAATAVSLYAILPVLWALVLSGVFLWTVVPGVIIARRVYSDLAPSPEPSAIAWLIGPVWGFAFSSIALLILWVAGVRHPAILALSPAIALVLAWPCSRLAGHLSAPRIGRRDLAPLLLVLLLAPVVVGRPYARVGEMRPEGKAYRAYFIADFEWRMTVAAEVSKGDIPPKNPFLTGDTLHYYWLPDLISGIEYRATRGALTIDQILLCNALLLDLAFLLFFYAFVRHFVASPAAAAAGCIAAVLFTSFEGAQQLYVFWKQKIPLAGMRLLNIDAISNWKFGSLKVDGLQRLLLYQPHHATAWATSLSGLLVVVQARDKARWTVNLLAGTFLATGLLLSSFIAVMVGAIVGIHQLVALASGGRWRGLVVAAIAGGIPAGIALLATNALQYVDQTGEKLVYIGNMNPLAATNTWTGIFLSFGPILAGALVGAVLVVTTRAWHLAVPLLMVAVATFFYFYVDVIDHQHAYVGFRAGHLLFMAFAALVAFAWQEISSGSRAQRTAAAAAAALVALAAAPMTAIDLYNSQDTANQMEGPGFRWTEIVTPDELEALAWLKANTPADALVQVDPMHDGGTWAYMPAFGERRMVAGMPISMIPIRKYQEASERMLTFFTVHEPKQAYKLAGDLKLEFVYVGPSERRKYPKLAETLDAAPYWFRPLFRNGTVAIYRVT